MPVPDQILADLQAELARLRAEIARLEEEASRHQRVLEAWRDLWAQYEATIEAFEGYIYICSSNYEVEFMNQRFIERTGFYPLGQKCYQVIHGLDHVCPWCVNERVFRGETVRWEVQSPKDGHWFYVVNTPIRHPDGSVSKMAMIQDITERKETEKSAREAEEKYRAIFDNAVEGIFQSTPDGRLLSVNPALARLHGFASPEEMLTAIEDIDREIFVDPARRLDLRQKMNEAGMVRDFEVEVYRRDRSKVWVRVNARAVRDEAGAISYYEGFIQELPAPRGRKPGKQTAAGH
jgi:PAS domain S-box-containing protein